MSEPRKPRPKNRPRTRKPIPPRMDIQGVVARNAQYIKTLSALEAMLPTITTNGHALEMVGDIIKSLEHVPTNLGSLNAFDKHMASKATDLILVLQKDWANIEDSWTKQTLKGYMRLLDTMAADLGATRASPRNMKEVLGRNFLGLQPQDVRTKGLLKTYFKETAMDLKILMGADAETMMQEQRLADHQAQNEAEARKEMREKHDEALQDDKAFEKQKVIKDHEEALREERQRNKEREKEKAHEEAIDEDRKRDTATASGVPFVSDAIRDKELIHSQALEMEEKAEQERQELRVMEKEKKKAQQKEAKAVAAHIENHQDDTVASAILGEVKAIHGLLKKGGVGVGNGTGSGSKKRKNATTTESPDSREEEIQKIMKTLGYSANDPEGRKLAEKALKVGVRSGEGVPETPPPPVVTPEIVEKDHDDAMRVNENIDRRQQEKAEGHDAALMVNANVDRKSKERNYIHNRDEAHERALEIDRRIDHGIALRTNAGMDRKSMEGGFVPNSPELHASALETNERMDAISKQQAQNAALNGHVASPPPTVPPIQTPPSNGGVVRGVLGRVRNFGSGIRAMAGMGVGTSALATGATVVGGLALGGVAGRWANNNLGLKSEGERMNVAADGHAFDVERNSHIVARDKGHQSFETMQDANRSRAQLEETESVRRASVESLERQGIDERMLEPTSAPLTAPVVNNYTTTHTAPAPATNGNSVVHIRGVHPSFMRYQEKRMARILHPQGAV